MLSRLRKKIVTDKRLLLVLILAVISVSLYLGINYSRRGIIESNILCQNQHLGSINYSTDLPFTIMTKNRAGLDSYVLHRIEVENSTISGKYDEPYDIKNNILILNRKYPGNMENRETEMISVNVKSVTESFQIRYMMKLDKKNIPITRKAGLLFDKVESDATICKYSGKEVEYFGKHNFLIYKRIMG